ncbi:hypothetical protein [Natrialba sp. INN-245]|uniref:hypothetical protein n=1 Tax=Natrialba sp. INN-245 TaxID=2690967 RepID=UPI00190F8523|nr:hypothetical protein [Natrialba sp. INN-245]
MESAVVSVAPVGCLDPVVGVAVGCVILVALESDTALEAGGTRSAVVAVGRDDRFPVRTARRVAGIGCVSVRGLCRSSRACASISIVVVIGVARRALVSSRVSIPALGLVV